MRSAFFRMLGSLRSGVAGVVALGLLVPLSIQVWLGGDHIVREVEEHIQRDSLALAATLATSLEGPVWDIALEDIGRLISSVMANNEVIRVRVVSAEPVTFRPIELAAQDAATAHTMTIEQPVMHGGQEIARVLLVIDRTPVVKTSARIRTIFIVTGAAQLALSMALLLGLLYRRLVRPVERLTRQSGALARWELDRPFPWHGTDEIATLGRHLDATREALNAAFEEIAAKKAAKELAEAASRAKSIFVASTSHELRTPLNAVIGMSHLAMQEEVSPKVEGYLNICRRFKLSCYIS